MGSIRITNLQEVLKGFDLTEKQLDLAAYKGVSQAALKVEELARRNANTGNHPPGQGHIPGTGPGPNVVTGNLVSKIVAERPVKGFRGYSADINSSAIYARAVEQGSPRWKSGVKYPYLEPAGQTLLNNGTLRTVFIGAFVMAIRGIN
jgi:hypothetical protein